MYLVEHAPAFEINAVISLVSELYDLHATARSLPSERDQNFLLTHESGRKFVLKIANKLEDDALLTAQSEAMQHIAARVSYCQRIVPGVNGRILQRIKSSGGGTNLVRLVTYLPGVLLGDTETRSQELFRDLGQKLGEIDLLLLNFDRPALHRNFHWDLANWQTVTTQHAGLIQDDDLRALITRYVNAFKRNVAPSLSQLRRSCIHGDPNDYNVLISEDGSKVLGIIDFGDMVYSYTIGDLAIAMAYVVLNNEAPLTAATQLVGGYNEALSMRSEEVDVVWELMLMRLCMSVCLAAYQQKHRPDNAYLDISQRAIRDSLPGLMAIDRQEVARMFGTL
jgi:Ser/Thr protein kinase RdoA (MazF antagonist)